MEKEIICPVCGKISKIEGKRIESISGMLEDIDGYTCGSFECPNCGLKIYSKPGPEKDDPLLRIQEIEEELEQLSYEIGDFRTARKCQILGTLLLRQIGSYGTSLKDAITWLQNIEK